MASEHVRAGDHVVLNGWGAGETAWGAAINFDGPPPSIRDIEAMGTIIRHWLACQNAGKRLCAPSE